MTYPTIDSRGRVDVSLATFCNRNDPFIKVPDMKYRTALAFFADL